MGSLNVFDGYCLFWMNFRALIRAAATSEQSACQAFFAKSLDAAIQAIAARTGGDCPICNNIV
jgi:hypothetical protein